MTETFYPQIGEIYLMRFSGTQHEQTGTRPGLTEYSDFHPNDICDDRDIQSFSNLQFY